MAETELSSFISGKKVTEPLGWQDITITAAFGDNSNQPEIETDSMEFVRDAADAVIKHVANGDIFEGLDYILKYRERNNTITIFDGFIDTSDDYEEIEPSFGAVERPNKVKVKFKGKNTVTNFFDKIDGITYGYLFDQGVIKDSDFTVIKTAIVKKSSFMEIAMALITIYILQKQLRDLIKEIQKTIAEIISILTGGITGSLAAAVYTVATALIQLAYAVSLLFLIIKMVTDLIYLLIPPIINNKGCSYRTLLSKVCDNYGLTFVSPITELDVYHYLPTKGFSNETGILNGLLPVIPPTKLGIPSTGDFGYLVTEMFELCKRMFWAKVDVIGNEVHLRNTNDPFWLANSTYKPPINIKFLSKEYNTSSLNQTRLTSFVIDQMEGWTIENATGTSFEIKTEPLNINNTKSVVIKGLDRVDFPVALPSSKTKLNNVESAVLLIAQAADALTKLIGKKSNLASQIQRNRINVLKVTSNDYSVAKCVPLINGHVPPNHRDILSAKFLVNKFHEGKSFVTGGSRGQKVIYNGVDLPFTLLDFQKTMLNGTFTLQDGRIARFIDIPWQFSKDLTSVNIEVEEVYTDKLIEKYYEP